MKTEFDEAGEPAHSSTLSLRGHAAIVIDRRVRQIDDNHFRMHYRDLDDVLAMRDEKTDLLKAREEIVKPGLRAAFRAASVIVSIARHDPKLLTTDPVLRSEAIKKALAS